MSFQEASEVVARLIRAEQHRGVTLEVEVRLAADVDDDPMKRAAGEGVRRLSRVVVGDRLAGVAADVEARAGDRESAELGLDLPSPTFSSPW